MGLCESLGLRAFGIQLRLNYGSRPLHTSGLDSSRAYVGLRNLGNSCYLNSVLQCFYGCGPLREDVSRQSPPKGPLAMRVQHLFQQLSGKNGQWDYVSPAAVLHEVFVIDEAAFQPGESADVLDCCHLLLDSCLSHPGLFREPSDRSGGSSQCLWTLDSCLYFCTKQTWSSSNSTLAQLGLRSAAAGTLSVDVPRQSAARNSD